MPRVVPRPLNTARSPIAIRRESKQASAFAPLCQTAIVLASGASVARRWRLSSGPTRLGFPAQCATVSRNIRGYFLWCKGADRGESIWRELSPIRHRITGLWALRSLLPRALQTSPTATRERAGLRELSREERASCLAEHPRHGPCPHVGVLPRGETRTICLRWVDCANGDLRGRCSSHDMRDRVAGQPLVDAWKQLKTKREVVQYNKATATHSPAAHHARGARRGYRTKDQTESRRTKRRRKKAAAAWRR